MSWFEIKNKTSFTISIQVGFFKSFFYLVSNIGVGLCNQDSTSDNV
jgi:hypothetical protein